jgi:uncharacterized membrane protein YeiH
VLPRWIELSLDLGGTFVFALSGALVAVRKDLDLVGVAVLSISAGLGGGMIRDLLLGTTPPAAFRNEAYLFVAAGAAIAGFFFHPLITRLSISILLMDALGLGFFAVVGTAKSLDAGLAFVPAVLLGVVTGAGGGVVRDLLASEIPLILRRDIYALAALLGAALFAVLIHFRANRTGAVIIAVAATFALRVLAIRFNWQAPRPVWRGQPRMEQGEPMNGGVTRSFSRQLRDASRDWKNVRGDSDPGS